MSLMFGCGAGALCFPTSLDANKSGYFLIGQVGIA